MKRTTEIDLFCEHKPRSASYASREAALRGLLPLLNKHGIHAVLYALGWWSSTQASLLQDHESGSPEWHAGHYHKIGRLLSLCLDLAKEMEA